ncbi:hypothetical protein A0H81_04393 [Grifola frondosa]|uniref:Phytocyanin domain-containing protein n=1 Tax=Grifola frondosa TaxID=5627 RepID=A0A1C7MF27_GRIFR|nr:hypothetical protein A0H81_04393 [Grifola frondosa]
MRGLSTFFGAAAILAGYASALPRPDSAYASATASAYGSMATSSADNSGSMMTDSSSSSAVSSSSMDSSNMSTDSSANMSTDSSAYLSTSTDSALMSMSTDAATSTSTSYSSSQTYGSGSSNWSGSEYNSCVQQCIASYGSPAGSWTPSTTDSGSAGSSGTGSTITVIVAPTQGVLRYVPFAVNASVGDTVKFMWGANNHTVTKSSQLELCNKTLDQPFASGEQNKDFVFEQVVNNTNTTFFYCGTPTHCQKGMFGMINPPNAAGSPMSIAQMMPASVANDSNMAAMMAYTDNMTAGNEAATNWGQNIDLSQLPEWSHASVMENVMYARAFFGANPEVLQADGTINMNQNAPLALPHDVSSVLNTDATPSAATTTPSGSSSSASAASTSASTTASANTKNGAGRNAASSALLAFAAIAATFLAL